MIVLCFTDSVQVMIRSGVLIVGRPVLLDVVLEVSVVALDPVQLGCVELGG